MFTTSQAGFQAKVQSPATGTPRSLPNLKTITQLLAARFILVLPLIPVSLQHQFHTSCIRLGDVALRTARKRFGESRE